MAHMHGEQDLTGVVFDIQRFSLHDGPGIRTTVFMKGCMLRCRWCQNPESFTPEPEIAFRHDLCMGCGACSEICPKDAILVDSTYRVNHSRCDACGSCTKVCPKKALFIIGQRYTITQLLSEVQRDAVFYEESAGGVTLSGGEPTWQFEFVHAFLKACKEVGLNTVIETNGFVSQEKLLHLMSFLDRVYFDLKVISPLDHRQLTGVNNDLILDNARWLVETGAPVTFRVPLVPGTTSTEANIHHLGEFLRTLGVTEIEICPYQNSWEKKLSWLHTSHVPLGLPNFSEEQAAAVIRFFSLQGITVLQE